MDRAKLAIERSVTHNRIVTLTASSSTEYRALRDSLSQRCDNSAEYAGPDNTWIVEYWGQDDDGDDWRVHVEVDRDVRRDA